ncbi:MAG: dimethyl sulfoxide reductase anchor subunit family protein, partial [Pseudomonadales bacterium]
MKPAFSVLVFTVTSGAGYGLFVWMVLLQLIGGETVEVTELIWGGLLGIILVTVGLLSSTLHLANPKNAWRAFNRFKTSWLSREGVFALLFYPLILGYALLLWLNDGNMSIPAKLLGILAIAVALTTVVCTGMIYASLKP